MLLSNIIQYISQLRSYFLFPTPYPFSSSLTLLKLDQNCCYKNMKMKSWSRLMTLLFVISVELCFNTRNSVSASKQCHFPAIFNFGDSNSDTGGLSAAFGQAGPPHGESFFHHPAGRYCDGRLIVDFIGSYFYSFYLYFLLEIQVPSLSFISSKNESLLS